MLTQTSWASQSKQLLSVRDAGQLNESHAVPVKHNETVVKSEGHMTKSIFTQARLIETQLGGTVLFFFSYTRQNVHMQTWALHKQWRRDVVDHVFFFTTSSTVVCCSPNCMYLEPFSADSSQLVLRLPSCFFLPGCTVCYSMLSPVFVTFFHHDPLCKEATQKSLTSKLNLTTRWAHTHQHNHHLEKQMTFSFRKGKKKLHEKQITAETYWLNESNIVTHSQSCWFKKPRKRLKMWKIIV